MVRCLVSLLVVVLPVMYVFHADIFPNRALTESVVLIGGIVGSLSSALIAGLVDCRKVTITSCYASKLVLRQTAESLSPVTNIPNSAALLNRVRCLQATFFAPSSS